MMKLKITVMPKEPLDNERWYRTAQMAARLAMMLRKVSFTYRNSYQMLLPGFTPNVGDAFGQKKVGTMAAPGLDFAFGLVDDSFISERQETTTGCSATTRLLRRLLPARPRICSCVPPWSR